MVNKKALILTGVLVVGAAVALLVDRGGGRRADDARLGKPLLAASAAPDVDKIELVKSGAAADAPRATLVRGADNVWTLADEGFPVDAAKVARFVDALTRADLQMLAGSTQGADDFGVGAGTTVTVSAKGQTVLTANLGDQRKGGGQYVTSGDDKVYLVSAPIEASLDHDAWEMKTLLDVPKDDVQSVSFTPTAASAKAPVTLSRAKKEDPLKVEGLKNPASEAPSAAATDGQFAAVAFSRRVDPGNAEAQAALAKPSRATVTLFDGRRYTLETGAVGDKTKKHFLRIQGEAPESLPQETKARVQALNELMTKHAFEVPQHIASRYEKGFSDFLTTAPKG